MTNLRYFERLDMTRGAAYAFMFLSLLFCFAAAFNIYLWSNGRTLRAQLKAERAARISQRELDVRQASLLRVSQCRQSIPAITRANILVADARRDHRDRAKAAGALALADPNPALAAVHRAIARQENLKAKTLEDFPTHTLKSCDRLATRLGVQKARER